MALDKYIVVSLLIVALLLAVGLYLCEQPASSSSTVAKQGFYAFSVPRVVKPVTLQEVSAKGSDNLSFPEEGGWRLVNFGYMFCPDICPRNLRLMAQVKDTLLTRGKALDIVHVTFDPARDTPKNLAVYTEHYHKDLRALTGDIESIQQLAQQLNVIFVHEQPDEYGNYFITHSDSLALLNPQGQYMGLFKGPYKQQGLIEVIGQYIDANEN